MGSELLSVISLPSSICSISRVSTENTSDNNRKVASQYSTQQFFTEKVVPVQVVVLKAQVQLLFEKGHAHVKCFNYNSGLINECHYVLNNVQFSCS